MIFCWWSSWPLWLNGWWCVLKLSEFGFKPHNVQKIKKLKRNEVAQYWVEYCGTTPRDREVLLFLSVIFLYIYFKYPYEIRNVVLMTKIIHAIQAKIRCTRNDIESWNTCCILRRMLYWNCKGHGFKVFAVLQSQTCAEFCKIGMVAKHGLWVRRIRNLGWFEEEVSTSWRKKKDLCIRKMFP